MMEAFDLRYLCIHVKKMRKKNEGDEGIPTIYGYI
jgi:hypothetical protein